MQIFGAWQWNYVGEDSVRFLQIFGARQWNFVGEMGFPNTQYFVRPPDFFPAHACSRHLDCQRREGGFASLRQYCRGQVRRTVPPTEMQIIVANKKDRNVDLPPPTFSFKFYQSDWSLPLKWKRLFWPFLCRGLEERHDRYFTVLFYDSNKYLSLCLFF